MRIFPDRKPYPKVYEPKKPNRRYKSMTIAAGFNFSDGALFCADTKHSSSMQLESTKIIPATFHEQQGQEGSKAVFVIAGRTVHARMIVQEAIRKISLIASGEMTIERIVGAIHEVLRDVHHNDIFPSPTDARVQLVFGIWSHVQGRLSTFFTDETAINEFYEYECLGSGEYLGRYLIRQLYSGRNITKRQIILTAATALMQIKNYDIDCGGNSQFILLGKNGTLGTVGNVDISGTEQYSKQFDAAMRRLFLSIADVNLPLEQVNLAINKFSTEIQDLTKYQKETTHFWEEIYKAIDEGGHK